jgi:hypothetical protein
MLCVVQAEVPATVRFLVRRSPNKRGVSEFDLETSKMRRPTLSSYERRGERKK